MVLDPLPGFLAELDQLTAGLASGDPQAVQDARCTLALLARDATPNLLLFVYRAIIAASEEPMP